MSILINTNLTPIITKTDISLSHVLSLKDTYFYIDKAFDEQ